MKCPGCGAEDNEVIDNIEEAPLDGGWPFVDLVCSVHCYECGAKYNVVYHARVFDGEIMD